MTNAPVTPRGFNTTFPDISLWDFQYALTWKGAAYRLRQLSHPGNSGPKLWILSRAAKDGKYDFLASGPTPEKAIQRASELYPDLMERPASSGPPPLGGPGSGTGGGG